MRYPNQLKRAFLLFSCWLLASVSSAQEVVVHPFGRQSMLPTCDVHSVLQDEDGYMWYGTSEGLCRDDGYTLYTYTNSYLHPLPLLSNVINQLADDHHGHLLLGTRRGLYVLDRQETLMREFPDTTIRGYQIDALCTTKAGDIWIATNGQVLHYDQTFRRVHTIEHPWKGANGKISYIHINEARQQAWWCSWQKSVMCYDIRRQTLTAYQNPDGFVIPSLTSVPGKPFYWVATIGNGIMRFDPQKPGGQQWTSIPTTCTKDNTLRCEAIQMRFDQGHGYLWCIARDNLYLYKTDRQKSLQPVALPTTLGQQKQFYADMCLDRSGNMWAVGTHPSILTCSFAHAGITRYNLNHLLSDANQGSITIGMLSHDINGQYWIHDSHLGLGLYNPSSKTFTPRADAGRIMSDFMEPCREGGVFAVNHKTKVFRQYAEGGIMKSAFVVDVSPLLAPGELIRTMYEDDKHQLWLGTSDHLLCYDLQANHLTSVCKGTGRVAFIRKAKDGTLYFTSEERGLLAWRAEKERVVVDPESALGFFSIAPNGMLWVYTQQGDLLCVDPRTGQTTSHGVNCGLSGEAVLYVYADAKDNVWLLTSKSIIIYHLKEQSYTTLSHTDAAIGMDFFRVMNVDGDGNIQVGGGNGFITFKTNDLLRISHGTPMPLYMTGIRIDNEYHTLNLSAGFTYTLQSDERTAELFFSTLDPLFSKSTHYAFRIGGSQWNNLQPGQNSLYLADLSSGRHHIELRATDNLGHWEETTYTFDLYVTPHWWETWWARTLFLLLFILLVVWRIHQLVVHRRQQRERRITQMVVTPIDTLLHSMQNAKEDTDAPKADEQVIEALQTIQRNTATLQGEGDLSPQDEALLKQATTLVEANLDNTDYSIEQLASDMAMSRVSLFRRLRSITGLSPTDFVKNIRLEHAAHLLAKGELNIVGVAYSVGFSTPSYFSKSFKQRYGVLPSEYAKNN